MRIQPQNPRENPKNPKTPNWVVLIHFQADRVSAVGADSGHQHCTLSDQGEVPPPDDRRREISRPAAAGRPRIGSANTAATATLGLRILSFSGQSRPTHTFIPPFLDPLNSFPWSFSPNSSLFERYDQNKFDRLLDRVFRPPQQPLDQGKGTDVFLVSWYFH